eukprot:1107500-Pyramimonas_sp.AAC.1
MSDATSVNRRLRNAICVAIAEPISVGDPALDDDRALGLMCGHLPDREPAIAQATELVQQPPDLTPHMSPGRTVRI